MRLRLIWQARGQRETIRFLAFQLAALTAIDFDELAVDGSPSLLAEAPRGPWGVRYRSEVPRRRAGEPVRRPPEDWRDSRTIRAEGHGDCEDLSCDEAAQLQLEGQQAIALPFFALPNLIHCVTVVLAPTIRIIDPSEQLGMRSIDADFSGAIAQALEWTGHT